MAQVTELASERVVRYLYRISLDRHLAEDLCQGNCMCGNVAYVLVGSCTRVHCRQDAQTAGKGDTIYAKFVTPQAVAASYHRKPMGVRSQRAVVLCRQHGTIVLGSPGAEHG